LVITSGCEIHGTITGYYSSFEQNYAVSLFLADDGKVGVNADFDIFRIRNRDLYSHHSDGCHEK